MFSSYCHPLKKCLFTSKKFKAYGNLSEFQQKDGVGEDLSCMSKSPW